MKKNVIFINKQNKSPEINKLPNIIYPIPDSQCNDKPDFIFSTFISH